MTVRVYGVLREFDLWIQVESGQAQLTGISAGGVAIEPNQSGVHVANLGAGKNHVGKPFVVAATLLRTQANSNHGFLTVSLYQTVPLDAQGIPIPPFMSPTFKFNPWTFDSIAVDLTGVAQRDATIAIDLL